MRYTLHKNGMDFSPLTNDDMAEIFAEGRRAAIAKASPFSCPYINDKQDDRFIAWTDGYRSVSDPKLQTKFS
jgi:hypothetical protein